MASDLSIALLTGSFALAGGLGGVLLSGAMARRGDRQRLKADDERRWLTDRRTVYAGYLGLTEAMLREIDRIGVSLPYKDGDQISPEDSAIVREELIEYFSRWEDELQPSLGEVQLLASPVVADLADRVSSALMDITSPVELQRSYSEYHPGWFRTQDLVQVLRGAMRTELGLSEALREGPVPPDWPWLPGRPLPKSSAPEVPPKVPE